MATNKTAAQLKQLAKQSASAMTGVPVSKIGKGKHPVAVSPSKAKKKSK
jgi:hypothetical protein